LSGCSTFRAIHTYLQSILCISYIESGSFFVNLIVIIIFRLLGYFLVSDLFSDHIFLVVDGFLLTRIDHYHVLTANLLLHRKANFDLADFLLEIILKVVFLFGRVEQAIEGALSVSSLKVHINWWQHFLSFYSF